MGPLEDVNILVVDATMATINVHRQGPHKGLGVSDHSVDAHLGSELPGIGGGRIRVFLASDVPTRDATQVWNCSTTLPLPC